MSKSDLITNVTIVSQFFSASPYTQYTRAAPVFINVQNGWMCSICIDLPYGMTVNCGAAVVTINSSVNGYLSRCTST